MRGTFLLDLHDLDAAGKPFEAPITPAWLLGALEGLEVAPTGEAGELAVRFSRAANDIIIKGHARARLTAPCSRCLEPVAFEARAEIALLLVPATSPKSAFAKGKAPGKPGAEEYEFSSEDADLDTYEGEQVVLDPFVREALLLEVPPYPLCSETCQGIAPPPEHMAPAKPAIDPRLAPLLQFTKKRN